MQEVASFCRITTLDNARYCDPDRAVNMCSPSRCVSTDADDSVTVTARKGFPKPHPVLPAANVTHCSERKSQ